MAYKIYPSAGTLALPSDLGLLSFLALRESEARPTAGWAESFAERNHESRDPPKAVLLSYYAPPLEIVAVVPSNLVRVTLNGSL
jgi:hypothetical protein